MRGYDQLEMALISRCNLKMMGSHTGVSLAADGPSQMALADVAFFRAYAEATGGDGRPMAYVLNPADGRAAYALTLAMAEYQGTCYLRAFRPDVPFLYDDGTRFVLGGHQVLREGRDLLVVGSGYLVHEALRAIDDLGADGVRAGLVDLYSLPFDRLALAELARRSSRRVLTVEDNYGGGFGSALADALSEEGDGFRVEQMFVRQIPKSGRSPDDLLRYHHLAASDIAGRVRTLVDTLVDGARAA